MEVVVTLTEKIIKEGPYSLDSKMSGVQKVQNSSNRERESDISISLKVSRTT